VLEGYLSGKRHPDEVATPKLGTNVSRQWTVMHNKLIHQSNLIREYPRGSEDGIVQGIV
jgi:hypothetical protein